MPIRIQADLPAIEVLESENIFVMTHERAALQDIRPLKIAILNLMPTKIETETQLLRLLGNTPLQVDVELLHMASHVSRNTSSYHLNTFYKTFNDVKDQRFDGLIITGAPVEKWTTGTKCVPLWNGAKRMCIPFSISAGARRPVFTTIMAFRSI